MYCRQNYERESDMLFVYIRQTPTVLVPLIWSNGLRGEDFLAVNCYSRSMSGHLLPLWVILQKIQPVVPVLSQMRLIIFTHHLISVHFSIIVRCTLRYSLPFLYFSFSCWNSEAVVISPMRATLPASLNLSIMRYSPQHPVTTLWYVVAYGWMGKFYTDTGTSLDSWLQAFAVK